MVPFVKYLKLYLDNYPDRLLAWSTTAVKSFEWRMWSLLSKTCSEEPSMMNIWNRLSNCLNMPLVRRMFFKLFSLKESKVKLTRLGEEDNTSILCLKKVSFYWLKLPPVKHDTRCNVLLPLPSKRVKSKNILIPSKVGS